jgi:endogenous inhibitor of DNA gyrase (YacG/DUF329 family)
MTELQKELIGTMRGDGTGYGTIAKELGLSENTVKSYCRRSKLNGSAATTNIIAENTSTQCEQCGAAVVQSEHRKHKRFCKDKCRMDWWNAHPGAAKRKTVNRAECCYCGLEFEFYGTKPRKYCSHGCYASDQRFWRNSHYDT